MVDSAIAPVAVDGRQQRVRDAMRIIQAGDFREDAERCLELQAVQLRICEVGRLVDEDAEPGVLDAFEVRSGTVGAVENDLSPCFRQVHAPEVRTGEVRLLEFGDGPRATKSILGCESLVVEPSAFELAPDEAGFGEVAPV